MEKNVSQFLTPPKTPKPCCSGSTCHAETQGILSVNAAVAIIQSMNDNGKISTTTEFDCISGKLANHVPNRCRQNYEKQVAEMRPKIQIEETLNAEAQKMAKILPKQTTAGC
jgi:hypothetical protein